MSENKFNPVLKLAAHPQFAAYLQRERIAPVLVEASLTGKCNAACPWCFFQDRKDRGVLPLNIAIRLVEDLAAMGTKAINWTGGGEPTLHPNFAGIVKRTAWLNVRQGLFTNALAPIEYEPGAFDWIRVSKTNHPLPIEHIKEIRDHCHSVGICINYTGNDREVREVCDIAHDLHLDYVQTRPALRLYGEHTSIEPPHVTDSLLLNTAYKFDEAKKDRIYDQCEGYHFVPFIWHDGTVSACGYMNHDSRYVLGNLKDSSIAAILNAAPRSLPVDKTCQICCKNHEINIAIHQARRLQDIDFI
jgi:MoaA/NifB/PqqE/SkfB family radical SAM enzyme